MREFPTYPSYEPAHLVCVPRALIPILCGKLAELEARDAWATDEDWRQGYTWIVALQADLMSGCIDKLIEGQDRIYRLLDTALNGTQYTATPAEHPLPTPPADPTKPTFSPAIPTVPVLAGGAGLGLRGRLERLIQLSDNLVTGTTHTTDKDAALLGDLALTNATGIREQLRLIAGVLDAGWFGIGGHDASVADIVRALRVGSPTQRDAITTALQALQGAGSAANIFGVVEGLFTTTANTIGEGAVVATLIASTMAQAALMGIQSGQFDDMVARLDRIIKSIDGGATDAPTTNVLEQLEAIGTNTADTTLYDEVETLLTDIKIAVQ